MVEIGRKRLALVAAGFMMGAAAPIALVMADSGPPKGVFDEISVKRINIVEPDGKYRLALSNSERFPGLLMEGKEYKHHSRDGGRILFFNDEGDEVGGLTRSEEHTSALQSLMRISYAVFCLKKNSQ